MRITIFGNSGSGKSTLARELAERHGLPRLDLDEVAWEPGKIAVPRDPAAARADVARFCESHPGWIIEGCYAGLIGAALAYDPTLIFLDPGVELCLEHCRARPWEPHKYESKAQQDQQLEFLLAWVRTYETRDDDMSRAAHEACFAAYAGAKQRLSTRPTADDVASIIA